ncbi:hypothetical protein ACFVIY_37785 [Streptomyces sp. NPDC127166]|uniref:hypothetical protein n=1 Tax=Streptomyces sp. NPDC127166 TaxID=3345380 RepID=UPI00362FFDE1
MKKTTRDEWRVMVTLKARRPADLGLTGIDDLAEFIASPGPLTIAVLPRPLGNFSFGSMSDRLVSDDIERDYRLRCEDIADELRRRPQVEDVSVCCTETHTCSHCGLGWEELTADEAADTSTNQDEHSVEGEPVCCEDAIAEFRTERGIPALRPRSRGASEIKHPAMRPTREHLAKNPMPEQRKDGAA